MTPSKIFSVSLATLSAASALWAEGAPAGPFGGGMAGVIPWVLIFGVFYFLLIRPQQKQAKEHKKMLEALQKGDQVLTSGGLYATITAVKGKVLEAKINDETKVTLSKASVSELVQGDPSRENLEKPTAEAKK